MKNMVKILAIVLVFLISSSAILTLVGGIEIDILSPWLNEGTAGVERLEIINYNYGVAPNSQVKCFYTTDKDVIADALNHYGSLRVSPVWNLTDMELYVGGASKDVVFTYDDGSEKIVEFVNDYYVFCLLLLNVNGSTGFSGDGMNGFYRFMANDEGYKVYTAEENRELVKEVAEGASRLGFEFYEGEADKSNATHIIETSFASIYVITDRICYLDIKNDVVGTGDGYFTLYDASFEQIIE